MVDGEDIDCEDVRWYKYSMMVKMFDGEDIRSRGCSNARMFGGWGVLLGDEKTTYKQQR